MADTDSASQDEFDKTFQIGKNLLVNQPQIRLLVDTIQQKKTCDDIESLTNFWLWVIKLFLKAVGDKTITLTNSGRQSIMNILRLLMKC